MPAQFLISSSSFQCFLEGTAGTDNRFHAERLTLATPLSRVSAPIAGGAVSLPPVAQDPAVINTPWDFGTGEFRFEFPAAALDISDSTAAVSASWDRLVATFTPASGGGTLTLSFSRLRIVSPRLPDLPLVADLTLVFRNRAQVSGSGSVQLISPHRAQASLGVTSNRIELTWATDFLASLPLPGVDVLLEGGEQVTLAVSGQNSPFEHLELTVTPSHDVIAESAFAWIRGDDRELLRQPDDTRPAAPILRLTVHTKLTPPGSLLLMRLDLGGGALPVFFSDLNNADWTVRFETIRRFTFPFLAGTDQSVALEKFDPGTTTQQLNPAFRIPVLFTILIANGKPDPNLPLEGFSFTCSAPELLFNPLTFAFDVTHANGIPLSIPLKVSDDDEEVDNPELGRNRLGLTWHFVPSGATSPAPVFLLVTQNSQYQVKLAAGAKVTAGYTRLTHGTEVIEFDSTDFAFTQGGINLTAEVRDKPLLLFGINTRFRFHDTRLVIVDGTIQDFTLLGTGSLPPALVGNSTVEAALQFHQEDDKLTLVSGGAQLRGLQPLECKAIRFRFSIDSLGLKFVDDGHIHFYFTLSGHAQFLLLPGDDQDGPLAALTDIKIPLIDVPLAGESAVLADHVNFLPALPSTFEFKFLKAFTFELKGFGFLPAADEFDGDPAIKFSGQMLFSKDNDEKSAKIDFHDILLGLPEDGEVFPRLFLRELAVSIKYGEAFQLTGAVEFIRSTTERGFKGEGTLQIKSLPQLAASFGYVRIREDINSPFRTAWFVFLEIDRIGFQIPEIELYLREIGLGFGYRFTLAAIKGSDQETDIKKLISKLDELSQTAGNLSQKDQWVTDLEGPGEDPRWTIALRALFAQSADPTSPVKYNKPKEENLPCIYMFDVIASFRSDLTFFMNVRGWLAANYNDYLEDEELKNKPLVTGYILLQARRKRFLAHVASHPGGTIGDHPKVPDFVKQAIQKAQFSATLLIEPGLFHLELGWPNMLHFTNSFGPIDVEFRAGFIFRFVERIRVTKTVHTNAVASNPLPGFSIAPSDNQTAVITWDNPNPNQLAVLVDGDADNQPLLTGLLARGVRDMLPPTGDAVTTGDSFLVLGISFQARAHLEINEGVDLAVFGAQLHASLDAAFGARMTAAVSLRTNEKAVYASISLEIRASFELILWIGLSRKLSKEWSISLSLTITAGLEFGLTTDAGVRGSGTVAVGIMGHDLQFTAHFEKDADQVEKALALTNDFLVLGLDATDVQPSAVQATKAPAHSRAATMPAPGAVKAPGTVPVPAAPAATPAPPKPDLRPKFSDATTAGSLDLQANASQGHACTAPGYTIFVKDGADAGTFFLLMPNGELPETGFLPAPPPAGVASLGDDFSVSFPAAPLLQRIKSTLAAGADTVAQQFDDVPDATNVHWSVNWDANPLDTVSARDFLNAAFLVGNVTPDNVTGTLMDPARPQFADEDLRDSRVQNPTDASFEAAVRGAYQQFRGSPFFKNDPNNPYDQHLEDAFSLDTSIYSAGRIPTLDESKKQQAIHTRGIVIHDLVSGFNDYVEAVKLGKPGLARAQTLPFQMGLVFRLPPGTDLPPWLKTPASLLPETGRVKVSQRLDRVAGLHPPTEASTFNIPSANFSFFPPRFENVRPYTSSNTIAIAWDLQWPTSPDGSVTGAQQRPDHHLMNYLVRRRALDGSEPESVYTVKAADVLTMQSGKVMRLKPRFQVVDHFNHETLDDQAALPVTGRTYFYTITPFDVGGNPGRPLTLAATRFPDEPPAVPTDAELFVHYRLADSQPAPVPALGLPLQLSRPANGAGRPPLAAVTWTDPLPGNGPNVPIEHYRLIFRRDRTVPVGSYGLDASAQGSRTKSLPTSNARPLPTDIQVDLTPTGTREARSATVDLAAAGVFPKGPAPLWRPEAWTVYFQTESLNGVPSALVPVKLRLRFTTSDDTDAKVEDRRPDELEFIPVPASFPLLPPVDMQAITGPEFVPMPVQPAGVAYSIHPGGERLVRFRWNQGPSGDLAYPLNLTAGYKLFQLDIDANTVDTFLSGPRLANAQRQVQEVQMLPPDDVLLSPNDTRSPAMWKAWYPSTVKRLHEPRVRGSENPLGPWHSWRDSTLVWPDWDGFTSSAARPAAMHPAIAAIIAALQVRFTIQVQLAPPMQDGDLDALFLSTAAPADPYGWGLLQRFGLSSAIVAHGSDGAVVPGSKVVDAIRTVLADAPEAVKKYLPFLFVELLYQPAKSTSLQEGTVDPATQLAMVQISLRPGFQAFLQYHSVNLSGTPGVAMEVTFTLGPGEKITLIDRSDPASGEVPLAGPAIDLANPAQATAEVKRTFRIPGSGVVPLLLRSVKGKDPRLSTGAGANPTPIGLTSFEPTDPASTYFSASTDLLAAKFAASDENWMRFKLYAESLSPSGKLAIPTAVADIKAILPRCLVWTNRFFENSAADPHAASNGPSTATAYPQSGTPVYVTPDDHGRLTYDHKILDPWAHNYRYYILPFGRYDVLWQGLRQSRVLFPAGIPAAAVSHAVTPAPNAPALDVVLQRTKPVATPVVLSSRRLDRPSTAADPAPPGPIWEVIVQQHAEQALTERNQTVTRQLSYRGIAFSVLRKFVFLDWMKSLPGLAAASPLQPVSSGISFPPALPPAPDHLDLEHLTDDQQRVLAIRDRTGGSLRGAIVLDWEGLPFFYQHRLLLIAQTDSTVSPVGGVVQNDFEYISPTGCECEFHGENIAWELPAPFTAQSLTLRSLQLNLKLKRLWDCLPVSAQQLWPNEEPHTGDTADTALRPGTVPDPEVVYQLIETFGGGAAAQTVPSPGQTRPPANVEMQAEFFVNSAPPAAAAYGFRQTGKHYVVQADPTPKHNAPATATDPFILNSSLVPITEVVLSKQFNTLGLANLAVSPGTTALLIAGVLKREDLDTLLHIPNVAPGSGGNLLAGVRSSPVLSGTLQEKVSYPDIPSGEDVPSILVSRLVITNTGVSWKGPMTAGQRAALLGMAGNRRTVFTAAVRAVIQQLLDPPVPELSEPYDGTRSSEVPPDLSGHLTIKISFPGDPGNAGWTLTWRGNMTQPEADEVRALAPAQDTAFHDALDALATAALMAGSAPPNPPPTNAGAAPAPALAAEPEFTQTVAGPFVSPKIDLGVLGPAIGVNLLTFFTFRNGAIACRGVLDQLDVSPDAIAGRIAAVLPLNHTFTQAFNALARKITDRSVSASYEGLRSIAAAVPLTDEEATSLSTMLGADDGATVIDFNDSLLNKQKLTAAHDAWFTQTAVSEVPPSLPALFDSPEPDSCTLVWKGALPAGGLNLGGDNGFQQAIAKLQSAADNEFTFAQAPLGLDQPPVTVRGHITFTPAAGPFQSLKWDSNPPNSTPLHITDSVAATLRHWAQIPQFAAAVNELIGFADRFSISITLPLEIPAELAGRLQLTPTDVALINPGSGDVNLLGGMIGHLPAGDALRAALEALRTAITPAPANPIVVRVTGTFSRRPAQPDIPARLAGQLVVTPTSVAWSGRILDDSQIVALRSLPGDALFRAAIETIATQLDSFAREVSFSTPIPPRPTQSALPAEIKDHLLLGKFRLRYHGIMSQPELTAVRAAFQSKTEPDKDALKRLYDDSLENAKQRRGLSIRARRASAAPGAPAPLTPKPPSIS